MPSLGLRSKACHKTIGTPSDGFHEDQFTSPVRLRVENAVWKWEHRAMAQPEVAQRGDLKRQQFSLGTMLAGITLLALILGWAIDHRNLQRALDEKDKVSVAVEGKLRNEILRHQWRRGQLSFSVGTMGGSSIGTGPIDTLLEKGARVYSDVRTITLDDAGTDADVAHFQNFPTLRCVHVSGNQFTDATIDHLSKLPNLRRAYLSGPWITDETVVGVAALTSLEALGLDNSSVSDAGLEPLGSLENLEILTLVDTPISDAGLRHLLPLKNLRELRLDKTLVSDAGIQELAAMSHLKIISLTGTKVTEAGLRQLQSQLPDCLIMPEPAPKPAPEDR